MTTSVRVADLIARLVAEAGLRQVFMVTGGGAMHLNDAFSRHPALSVLFMHHEQACAMAAEGYARQSGETALVNVTTGPGAINALNGVFGAWTDSVPMLVVSGQVRRETIAALHDPALRQLGDQEADVLAMARPITKFAGALLDPQDTAWLVGRALWIARSGRPGPVWIDVPVDVQGMRVDPADLRPFVPDDDAPSHPNEARRLVGEPLREAAREVAARLARSERPVLLPGSGVHWAGAAERFRRLADRLGVPVATGFNAHDLLPHAHPAVVGQPGTIGDRAGNFAVQNADLVLVLGCRLGIRQVSYNWSAFARAARVVMVDIDAAELRKHTLNIDLPVQAELGAFLDALEDALRGYAIPPAHAAYLAWCRERRERYPTNPLAYAERAAPINPYAFLSRLWDALAPGDTVVAANATACIVSFQTARLKAGQRLFSNSGAASMGYDLPAAIGACIAGPRGRTVCLAGDGSIMMNLQELQTIVGNRLPITIILLNNAGYSSIRQSQQAWFPDNLAGCGPLSGVTFPDFLALAAAFGLPARRIASLDDAAAGIAGALAEPGPALLEVVLDTDQPFAPKLASRRLPDGRMVSPALEDMAPFLSRDELADNMLIPPDAP